jgi:hypothetical protein
MFDDRARGCLFSCCHPERKRSICGRIQERACIADKPRILRLRVRPVRNSGGSENSRERFAQDDNSIWTLAKTEEPKAKSQKRRAKSEEPKAKSQKRRAKSEEPKAKS